MKFFESILDIIFPNVCCTCSKALTKHEEIICFGCRSKLPKTNFYNSTDNELSNRLYGKIETEFCASYLYYYKSGITQKLLHQFKYNNFPEIGEMIGTWFGHDLIAKNTATRFDIIIPVPLHQKKERKRGYNQSQHFAKGISDAISIPVDFNSLIRIEYQKSQTQKTKEQRWKNVHQAFFVTDPERIKNKRILLVDDVITTGATIEACGRQLLLNGANSIGIASMALAK